MTKKNISRGQKFSLTNTHIRKLKSKKGIKIFHASKRLKNKEHVKKVLFDCFCRNDMEAFKEALKSHFELQNKDKIIKKARISKATFYRTISKNSNPTLKSISKLLKAV